MKPIFFGHQPEKAPRNPVPPDGACSGTSAKSIDSVVALVVEAPRHKPSDSEWKDAMFTPTTGGEVM